MMRKKETYLLMIAAVAMLLVCIRLAERQKQEVLPVNYQLSNRKANDTTKAVYAYLSEVSGSHVLSAQQESTWMGTPEYEMDYLQKTTGRLPAMRGLDFMHDDFWGVIVRASAWWKKGGLVTICWHTGADFSGEWKDCMETSVQDWDAVLTEGTPEHQRFLDGMDKAAKALKELEKRGVTVIWRPFHEFDGKWFWWGKGGAANFVRLWRLMYDRYTNYWALNNLIWVLGYSHQRLGYHGWYPGDEYVDIIGADSYQGGAQNKLYRALRKITTNKPFAFHECGTNPTAEELSTTPWSWFMTWHTNYLTEENKPEKLRELYNSDYVVTLDELPDFLQPLKNAAAAQAAAFSVKGSGSIRQFAETGGTEDHGGTDHSGGCERLMQEKSGQKDCQHRINVTEKGNSMRLQAAHGTKVE